MPVARIVQLSAELESKRIAEKIRYIEQHVPYGIVNQEFYDNIEKAKEPLVKIYHYHCNHLGTPQELSDEKGDVIWLSYDRAWGGSFDSLYKQQFVDNFAVKENELQPFKFQGQSLDTETGLHYNRFRYYDSDVGMFVSRDPIGLMGGDNTFQYAPNPIEWIDPSGLLVTPTYTRGKNLRVERVQATILKADLNSGTSTNASSRLEAQKMGNCSKWHAGHLLAKRLGGSGGVGHIFPQTPNINTGAYRVFEGKVYDAVNLHGSASVDIQFKYPNVKSKVPNLIIYSYTSGGKSIEQEFLNPSPCT